MKSGLISYLAWFGPYAVGILAIAYSVMLRLREPSESAEDEGRGSFLTRILTIVALLLVGLLLIGLLFQPKDLSWRFGLMFLIGGLAVVAAAFYSRWRVGSGFAASSDAFFGVGLALIEVAFLRNYFREAPMLYLLVLALGAWFAVAVFYYGRPNGGLLGPRSAALTSMVLAGAVAIGIYKYAEGAAMGTLFAIDACAMALLVAIIASLVIACCKPGVLQTILGILLIVVGVWRLVGLLGEVIANEPEAGLCVITGCVTVLAVYLLSAASGGLRVGAGFIGANEAGALCVLLAIACAAISMRWLGGYGVALASIGGLASLPFVYMLIDRAKSGGPELELANGGAGIVAALAAIGLVRVFAESTGGTGAAVHIFESYVLIGLILGAVLSLIMASISDGWAKDAARPIGGVARGAAVVAAAIAIVFAAAYFWRFEAVVGLMLGFTAGLFFLIPAAPFFGKQMGAPDVALGVQVFVVTCAPWFLASTIDLTREQKVAVMLWTLAVMAVLIVITSVIRLRRSARAV
ncbi:MAG: hypothetical protein NT018_05185 [Armatimonadetes bacterium]|nr:hypothetical protein [Armatimonadota bacterium]